LAYCNPKYWSSHKEIYKKDFANYTFWTKPRNNGLLNLNCKCLALWDTFAKWCISNEINFYILIICYDWFGWICLLSFKNGLNMKITRYFSWISFIQCTLPFNSFNSKLVFRKGNCKSVTIKHVFFSITIQRQF